MKNNPRARRVDNAVFVHRVVASMADKKPMSALRAVQHGGFYIAVHWAG